MVFLRLVLLFMKPSLQPKRKVEGETPQSTIQCQTEDIRVIQCMKHVCNQKADLGNEREGAQQTFRYTKIRC